MEVVKTTKTFLKLNMVLSLIQSWEWFIEQLQNIHKITPKKMNLLITRDTFI